MARVISLLTKNKDISKSWQLRDKLGVSLILIVAAFLYLTWAYFIDMGNAPDEMMRYQIPQFIFKHDKLPTGYDEEVVYSMGNWSYAFYPQFLGAILSTLFMKIVSIFNSSEQALLFGARLTSVCFGLFTVYFTGKTVYLLTKRSKVAMLLSMVLIAFYPQFIFLSAYVNNDIIAVCGSSIIIYAMVLGMQQLWNRRSILFLSFGMIICALGYLNSYGFILIGGLYFILSSYFAIKSGKSTISKFFYNSIVIFLLVGICVFPFFIRNYLLYDDFLGMRTFHNEYLRWLNNGGAILQHPYRDHGTLLHLLTKDNVTLLYSFIGLFGHMTVLMRPFEYLYYIVIFMSGLFGAIIVFISKRRKKADLNIKKENLFIIMIVLGIFITLSLQVYYSYTIDYQPQGRYIMSVLPPLVIGTSLGLTYWLRLLEKRSRKLVFIFFCMIYVLAAVWITRTYIILL